jgi:metal-responsive CopG/Arc/MetJ family transcriptional regulator
MPAKVKVTVSLDADLVEALDRMGREKKRTRSRVLQEALRAWQKTQIEQQLAEGYRAMAAEDLETAERGLAVFRETLR